MTPMNVMEPTADNVQAPWWTTRIGVQEIDARIDLSPQMFAADLDEQAGSYDDLSIDGQLDQLEEITRHGERIMETGGALAQGEASHERRRCPRQATSVDAARDKPRT